MFLFIPVVALIALIVVVWVVGNEVHRYFNYGRAPLADDPQMQPDEYDWWTGEPIWHSDESYQRQLEMVSRGKGWAEEIYTWDEMNAMYKGTEAYYAQLDNIPAEPGDGLDGLRRAAAESARLIAEERKYAPNIKATAFSAVVFLGVIGIVLALIFLVDKSGVASTSNFVQSDFGLSTNTVVIGIFFFIIWGVLLGLAVAATSVNGFAGMVVCCFVLGGLFLVFTDPRMGPEGSFVRSISTIAALACGGMSLSCAIGSIICFVKGI